MSDRRYEIPPKNRRALEQRLRNVISDTELQQRARRQLGYVALAATLVRHARDEKVSYQGDPGAPCSSMPHRPKGRT